MTHKITPHQITLTQGDTLRIPIHFYQDITGASVRMQVRPVDSETVLIDAVVTDHLNPVQGDTVLTVTAAQSDIPVGTYRTDMAITFQDGTHYTFYPPTAGCVGKFIITEQVTKAEG